MRKKTLHALHALHALHCSPHALFLHSRFGKYVDARRNISNIFNINTNNMIIMENFNKTKFFFCHVCECLSEIIKGIGNMFQ